MLVTMLARKEKGNQIAFIGENRKMLFLILAKKNEEGYLPHFRFKAKSREALKSIKTFSAERYSALADFVAICQKIGGAPLGEDAYETNVWSQTCDEAEFSLIAQTRIGHLRIEKSYPLSFERFAQEVFDISDLWNENAY